MPRADDAAERLHRAVERLLRGDSLSDVSEGMPEEMLPLLGSAAELGRSAGTGASGPRPSFVLGLEEQLRAEMRLAWLARPSPSPANHARLAAMLVAGIFLVGAVAWRGAPPVLRDGLARAVARVASSGSIQSGDSDWYLDRGWQRLRDLEPLLERVAADDAELAAALDEIASSYIRALDLASHEGDPLTLLRTKAEAGMAIARLEQLRAAAGTTRAGEFDRTAARIGDRLAAVVPARGTLVSVAPWDGTPATATPPSPAVAATGSATRGVPATESAMTREAPATASTRATVLVPSPSPPPSPVPATPREPLPEPPTASPPPSPTEERSNIATLTPRPTRDDHKEPTTTPPSTFAVPTATAVAGTAPGATAVAPTVVLP